MANKDEVFVEENDYLKKVLEILCEEIQSSEFKIEDRKKETSEFKKMIWNMRGELSDYEYNMQFNQIDNDTNSINDKIKKLINYKKSLKSPYFGRIDFKFHDRIIPVYVGITTLKKGRENYIFDWRAPISSLFYNYSMGQAEYKAPRGIISGEITLRRQYKIANGKLERVIESDINIDDEVLQEVLANSSTDKMKDIVTTIQREQNEIIRNNSDNHLIVQGVAGSGKTSVALHRIAFLLYQRVDLNSNNILIFSPNDVFSEYISEVLPALGEENVLNTTFSELSREYMKGETTIQSFTEFLESYYDSEITEEEFAVKKFKLSDDYKSNIDKFLNGYLATHRLANSISMIVNKSKEIEMDKDEVNMLLYEKYQHLPFRERIDLIAERICDFEHISYAKCGASIRNKIIEELGITLDSKKLYKEFLSSVTYLNNFDFDASMALNSFKGVSYEDLVGRLYLNFELNGYPYNTKVKHIVIDEAQDYSKLQFYIIKRMFPKATFTILGDVNQTINPYYKYESLSSLQDVYGEECQYYELSKSYRSCPEVIGYANDILGLKEKPSVRYASNLPVKTVDENNNLILQLYNDIEEMKKNGLKRIAIVTKNNVEAEELLIKLKELMENVSLASDNMSNDNIMIVPSYIAKGLEFDGVIVYTKKDDYYTEEEKNLYYVVCTRAQHQLIVYNQPSLKLERPKILKKEFC